MFLPRHGRGHIQTPTSINYRANIDALKRAGVTDVISVSACGSFKEELPPGTFVIVDQFIDRTLTREKSFFGPGFVAHVSMAHPVCAEAVESAIRCRARGGIQHADGGTYLAMEGPQFSSLAELLLYKSWGCSVIGMTAMPEAKLAREAELPYALVAMVTDYDCWHRPRPRHRRSGDQGADRQRRERAQARDGRRAEARPESQAVARASTTCSTPPSSPPPKSATARCSRSSMRWRGGC